MSPRFWKVLLATFLLGVGSLQAQEDAHISLFGIALGDKFVASKDYIPVQEEENDLYYSRKQPTNPEYLLQGVGISKTSHIVVKVDGRTPPGPFEHCQRILSETVLQLTARYPKLSGRRDEVDGTTWHNLGMTRTACSVTENVAGMSLRLPCGTTFYLHCERLSNAFVIEATDDEYQHIAREEAKALAMSPKRNHLD